MSNESTDSGRGRRTAHPGDHSPAHTPSPARGFNRSAAGSNPQSRRASRQAKFDKRGPAAYNGLYSSDRHWDSRILAIVRFLARRAAEIDFEQSDLAKEER